MKKLDRNRYLVTFGPNTRQWWIYDEYKDVYIDPPASLLKHLEIAHSGNLETQGEMLQKFVDKRLSWLYDEYATYAGDSIEI